MRTENHPILNQLYNILAELHNQGKQITLFKVPAHIGIKGNEETDKAAKQAIDMTQWRDSRKKHNILDDIRKLLGKECEVEKMTRFLREIGLFEEI